MTKIKKLPDEVIMHIAAGQVVDKPVSVVKELLENAIDAHSTSILVEIQGGGFERIVVVDNGDGMNKSDVQMCFLPHTTSKIVSIDDLIALSTHGFRGEALASIAAVGTLSIASRQATSVRGWKVEIEQGECITSEPIGMPIGTRIEVQNLFRDMPVRKGKKSTFSKLTQEILDSIVRLALVYQEVEFELVSDGKRILHTSVTPDPSDRIDTLFGEKYRDQLIPIQSSDVRYTLSGYIGKPSIARPYPSTYLSVNNRPIRDPALYKAIKQTFATLIPARYNPFVILDVTVPHEDIDINIDPQKHTIQMYNSALIYTFVSDQIKGLLHQNSLIPRPVAKPYSVRMDKEMQYILKDEVNIWSPKEMENVSILQVNKCFLVWEHHKNIYIADQHAVHERILYEQIKAGFYELAAKKAAKKLLKQHTLRLSVLDSHALVEHLPALETMGFEFIQKDSIWQLLAVPQFLHNRDYDDLISEILHTLSDNPIGSALDHVTHATITYMACREAIKAGDSVSEDESKKLIVKLFQCENPYSCPHGRPTVQLITDADLKNMFKRS